MPAHREGYHGAPGPVSESLQGMNPREVGADVAAGAMGICGSPAAWRARAEIGERGNAGCRCRQAVVARAVVAFGREVIEAPLAAADVATGERCRCRPSRSGNG